MRVYDNKTPRGRWEDSPPRPLNIPQGFGSYTEDGTGWREGNKHAFLFNRRPLGPTKTYPATCAVCEAKFQTAHPTTAKTCSDRCRQRRRRSRRRR